MEAKGTDDRDGGRGRPWSNLGFSPYSIAIGSSSSSEGTIASTGYTFTGSHVSSISTEASMAMYLPFDYYVCPEQMEMKRKHMNSMVQEFFGAPLPQRNSKTNLLKRKLLGAQSANRGILERWLAELGVDWVLHLADDGGAAVTLEHIIRPPHTQSWIRALAEITETIRLALASLFPVPDRGSLLGLPSISEDKAEEPEAEVSGSKARASPPDQFQYAQFIHETMSEMLVFVDVIVAPNAKAAAAMDRGGTQQQQYGQLSTLLRVHDALSRALAKIRLSFHSSSTAAQVQRIQGKTVGLLSAREAKVGEATWSTLEHIRTRVLESIEDGVVDSSDSQISIHMATRSVTRHISFLRSHYSPVNAILSEAASLGKYVPQIGVVGDLFPLNSMIVELASCLEEKLVNISKSFPDQAVGFLFLLNNLNFIRERLLFLFLLNNSDFIRGSPQTYSSLDVHVAALFDKVEGYIESYLLVSWAPVLSCLFNPTPLCFGKRHYSPLPKFESEFQKTYTTQKLWKVPDPQLRKMLREAIIEKITPVYRKYIEDNNVTVPKFTPQELQEMLQELFEG